MTNSQRMTWTAFAILAMFSIGPSRVGQQKIFNVRSIFDGIFLWGWALWCRVSNSISDSVHQVQLSHVVHIQLVLLFQNLDPDGGVLLRDCGVLVEGG